MGLLCAESAARYAHQHADMLRAMAWGSPADIPGVVNPDAKAAAEAVEAATGEAKFRADLLTVLREIRDALRR